jgi:nucleotide-binding universal stress UspA family protein
MKSLLAVVGAGDVAAVLATALLVARRFNSHIVGMHGFGSEFADKDDAEVGLSIASDLTRMPERGGDERRDQAWSFFGEFLNSPGVPVGTIPPGHDGPSASWLERNEHQNPIVGIVGRAYDLIVVKQPRTITSIAGITFEEALFESGRPVLLVPKGSPPAALGEVIAIAWNGSAETAQTVALGMPFLERARQVVIVAVEPQQMPEPGPTGEELARALKRYGINVGLRVAAGRQKAQGESFLKEATAAGADLLLKGAYTRGRIRQMIFGGATRHIILESTIPVLMAR